MANRYELISAALEASLGHPPRAEKDVDHLKLFVDPINVNSLMTNANQLVYGRRGAGKTMLFRSIRDIVSHGRESDGVYCLYYTATDFRSSPDETANVRTMAHRYFHAFVQLLVDDILALMDRIMADPSASGRLSRGGAERRAKRVRIDNLGVELLEASGYGSDSVDLSTKTSRREVQTSITRRRSRQVNLDVARKGQDVGVAASAQKEAKSSISETVQVVSRRQFEPHKVRTCLRSMLEELEVDHLIILIDEWMSLTECQVDFAERLKQCLFNEPRVAVKIAADQYQGALNNSEAGTKFKGVEVGADIALVADLDDPFRDPGRSRSLYGEALYRRLLQFEPSLESVFGDPSELNVEYFLESVFQTSRTFDSLCYASQGLCRDFLQIFELAAKKRNLTVTSKDRINADDIATAVVDHSRVLYARIEEKIDLYGLFEIISDLLSREGTRYFVVPTTVHSHDDLLRNLMQERVIHGVDRSLLHPSIRAQYRVFEINFGVFLEAGKAREFITGATPPSIRDLTIAAGQITADNVERHVLDLSLVERSEFLTCGSDTCRGRVFSKQVDSYRVARRCPFCFEVVD